MNYYNILGVNPTDTKEQIKKAYRKLALQHHPDKGGNAEKFKKISVAFEILFNDEARRDYDEELRDPSKPRKSKGGLEAPKFDAQETIYKKIDAHREIKEKLEKHNIYFIEDLGAEYLGLFGHDYCWEGQSIKGDYFSHIWTCCDTQLEVEIFKNQTLLLIDIFVNDLKELKETVIKRIEEYSKKLKPSSKDVFENGYKVFGLTDKDYWKNYILFSDYCARPSNVLQFEKDEKKFIDDLCNDKKDKHEEIFNSHHSNFENQKSDKGKIDYDKDQPTKDVPINNSPKNEEPKPNPAPEPKNNKDKNDKQNQELTNKIKELENELKALKTGITDIINLMDKFKIVKFIINEVGKLEARSKSNEVIKTEEELPSEWSSKVKNLIRQSNKSSLNREELEQNQIVPNNPSTSGSENKGLSLGHVIALVAIVATVVVMIGVIFWLRNRRNKKRNG